jgi:hypothetical protein
LDHSPIQEDIAVLSPSPLSHVEPGVESALPAVQVLPTEMRIHDLSIERPAVIAYIQSIPAEKRSIALVHALEVGITEVLSRRERFRG